MAEPKKPSKYYVLFCVTKYRDFEQAKSEASETIRVHLARSNMLHKQGNPIMAGAFLNNPDEPLTTMSVRKRVSLQATASKREQNSASATATAAPLSAR